MASVAPTTTSEPVGISLFYWVSQPGLPASAFALLPQCVKIKPHFADRCQAENNDILQENLHDYAVAKGKVKRADILRRRAAGAIWYSGGRV